MLRNFGLSGVLVLLVSCAAAQDVDVSSPPANELRIGMIGLDTSHCIAFAKLLNAAPDDAQRVPGGRVVLVYPKGSPDIASSVSRVPQYTKDITALGVQITDDLEAMVAQVDAVLLETNDGRPHLEQVVPVLRAGRPVFIDKPIAGSLSDCIAIFELARHYETPVFSSSSLRYGSTTQEVRHGAIGDVLGCDTYSPCALEPTHPDLFWYGIHGCESLFTVMGPGCETVIRTQTPDFDQVTGVWSGGRIGTFRGMRRGKSGYGGTAFGMTGTMEIGKYDGYRPLLVEVVRFFQTRQVPVAAEETINLYAFMEAADESRRRGFVQVSVAEVVAQARGVAEQRVKEILAADSPRN